MKTPNALRWRRTDPYPASAFRVRFVFHAGPGRAGPDGGPAATFHRLL